MNHISQLLYNGINYIGENYYGEYRSYPVHFYDDDTATLEDNRL